MCPRPLCLWQLGEVRLWEIHAANEVLGQYLNTLGAWQSQLVLKILRCQGLGIRLCLSRYQAGALIQAV